MAAEDALDERSAETKRKAKYSLECLTGSISSTFFSAEGAHRRECVRLPCQTSLCGLEKWFYVDAASAVAAYDNQTGLTDSLHQRLPVSFFK